MTVTQVECANQAPGEVEVVNNPTVCDEQGWRDDDEDEWLVIATTMRIYTVDEDELCALMMKCQMRDRRCAVVPKTSNTNFPARRSSWVRKPRAVVDDMSGGVKDLAGSGSHQLGIDGGIDVANNVVTNQRAIQDSKLCLKTTCHVEGGWCTIHNVALCMRKSRTKVQGSGVVEGVARTKYRMVETLYCPVWKAAVVNPDRLTERGQANYFLTGNIGGGGFTFGEVLRGTDLANSSSVGKLSSGPVFDI